MPPEKVAALDRRATDSGLDRTKYVLRLVEQDLARTAPKSKRRFASLHYNRTEKHRQSRRIG